MSSCSSTLDSDYIPVNISTPVTLTETVPNTKSNTISPSNTNVLVKPSNILIDNDDNDENETIICQSPTQNDDKQEPKSLSLATQLISLFCAKSKQKPEMVESLPIFLYPKLKNDFSFLVHFTFLTKLELIFCKITNIDDFLSMNNWETLKILNLSNNKLQNIDAIKNMINLQELHIGENEICSLDVISNLPHLIILDFHDNNIKDLKPIIFCTKLKIIRGGNNKIHTIRNYLDEMQFLEFVNLSGNYLLYYDEIDIISTIPKLKHLQLSDPHFGSNPICDLSNYHIYSLYKLKQIQSLDGIKIDDISKQKAQISMYKKTMFYQILYNVFSIYFSLSYFVFFSDLQNIL